MLFKLIACWATIFLVNYEFSQKHGAFATSIPISLLRNEIEKSLECRPNPALSVAVVKDGKALLTDGFGVKSITKKINVTADTKFSIASLTKAFSALLMLDAMAKNGSVNLNSKIKDVIGGNFHFYDTWRTSEATIEDLLSHRLRLPGNDAFRFNSVIDRYELLRRMKFFQSDLAFRVRAKYSSTNYLMATAITELISGNRKWEQLVADTIFGPLGMTSDFAATVDYDSDDVASAVITDNGQLMEISPEFSKEWNSRCGSGCIFASAKDMARWMNFLLSEGTNSSGHQVLPMSEVMAMFKSKAAMSSSSLNVIQRPTFPMTFSSDTYGLGWYLGHYRGYKTYVHTGTTPGYGSLIALVPDLKVGVYISLTGDDFAYQYRLALASYILDTVIGEAPWLNSSTLCTFPSPWKPGKSRRLPKYDKDLKLPRSGAEFIGIYNNDLYGEMKIEFNKSVDSDCLYARYGFGLWKLLPQKTPDEFYGKGEGVNDFYDISPFNFETDKTGTISSLTVKGFNTEIPPVFNKQNTASSSSNNINVLRMRFNNNDERAYFTQSLNFFYSLVVAFIHLLIN